MVQSNSSERLQKNNGNYAKFRVPSMWYKNGLSTMLILLRGFHIEQLQSLDSYKCLRLQMLCVTCSTVGLLQCILSRSKFFWQSVTRFLMDYVIRFIWHQLYKVLQHCMISEVFPLSTKMEGPQIERLQYDYPLAWQNSRHFVMPQLVFPQMTRHQYVHTSKHIHVAVSKA